MIKYFLRKIYKDADKETQDILLKIEDCHFIIELLCLGFLVYRIIFLIIPLLLMIVVCENIKFSINTQIAIITFIIIYYVVMFTFYYFFKEPIFIFLDALIKRVYFLTCTTKGGAIAKDDFKIIKQYDDTLYTYIATQLCRNCCYSICFEICKALEKGAMEFVAVKKFSYRNKEDDGRNFAMHVLYINNGWAFDTFSARQYPTNKLHEIYKAKICKIVDFDEIKNKSYEEFKEEQEPYLNKWADNNDCSSFLEEN